MSLFVIIAPVFGIIVLGYAAGRTGYLTDETGRGIADFAFNVAIPALLFKTILTAHFEGLDPIGILGSFFGSAAVAWIMGTLATRTVLQRPATDAPAVAMCAVFGNTVMLGLPIGMAAFGSDALAPISVILGIHAPVFLVTATTHSALVDRADGEHPSLGAALSGIAAQLARQPLIVAIALATLWRALGVWFPEPLLKMVDMLAQAGVPAALLALGMSLRKFTLSGNAKVVAVMLVLKLIAMPLIAAFLAVRVFHLPRVSAQVVMLMSALPAGANAYLYSTRSGTLSTAASGAVAAGTALSAVTLAALIAAVTAWL